VISGVSAGFGRRFAALLYDWLLLLALMLIFTTPMVLWVAKGAITFQNRGAWAYAYRFGLLAIVLGYYLVNWTRSGQTLGMRAWKLRLVTDAGKRVPWRAAWLRLPCSVLAWAACGLGVLWLYVDRDGAAAQDRLSHTRVVRLNRA
jgi:uncharacterized RDD family membrane protein YckC